VTFFAVWRVHPSWTLVKTLRVLKAPAGATIHITCTRVGGKSGCPFKKKNRPVTKPGTVTLTQLFTGRHLRPGTHLALKVTKPGFVGKGVIYKIRARKRPTVTKT
jgi:hypothetical protein